MNDPESGASDNAIESGAGRSPRLDSEYRRQLLELARASIRHGLDQGRGLSVSVSAYPSPLQALRASFVTLSLAGRLRGCIGRLEASRPLVEDIADNAFSAAFRDPRFPPLAESEFPRLEVHISILSPPSALQFSDQADLLRQLRPGVDGLILIEGRRRGTFLPSVWESLPDPSHFLGQLKLKAGLPADHWSNRIEALRYTTESFDRA